MWVREAISAKGRGSGCLDPLVSIVAETTTTTRTPRETLIFV